MSSPLGLPTHRPPHILIPGGSLAGLFTGLALSQLSPQLPQPLQITILERNPTPLLHDQGAGIVAGGPTLEFLRRFNRFQRPLTVTSHARQYLDRQGTTVEYEERGQRMTSWDLLWNVVRRGFDGGGEGAHVAGCGLGEEDTGRGEEGTEARCEYLHDRMVTGIARVDEDGNPDDGAVRVFWKSSRGETGSITADLLIAADGPGSSIRKLLTPSVERTYAGYVAFRGTVPESELSSSATAAFVEKFTFFHAPRLQILAYTIPGPKGALEPGRRLVNWVWYVNFEESSLEYEDLMTDTSGHRHQWTLPAGQMRAEVWEDRKRAAESLLPPQFAELVLKTQTPFVQAITDVMGEECEFWYGKVLMCGDSVAGFRPHTAASTSQAAFDAMGIYDLLKGEYGLDEWKARTMDYARSMQKHGMELGNRSQFGEHPLAR